MTVSLPLPRIAFSYLRISSRKQGKEGRDGIGRQTQLIDAWLARNTSFVLDTGYRDLGVSGFKGAHRTKGALGGFLDRIKRGEIAPGSVLLIENIDRLSREPIMDAYDLFSAILRAGVEVITLQDGKPFTRASLNESPGDVFMLIGAMQTAHRQSAEKSFRVGSAWRAKKRRAAEHRTPLSKTAPAWINPIISDEGKHIGYKLDTVGAATVLKIFELADQGQTASSITHYLVSHPKEHPPLPGTWSRNRGPTGGISHTSARFWRTGA